MPRYRTTFSSTVKPETLEYIDSKVDKANGISRGSVIDSIIEKSREKEQRNEIKKAARG